MVSHRRMASTSLLFSYSFATSSIVFLIESIYSSSANNEAFSFQKPGPLGFELFIRVRVMREWSDLKPVKISALVTAGIKLELIKKKSKRHFISGQLLLQVKCLASGLSMRHMSTKSKESIMYLAFSKDFSFVTGLPPCLSFCTSKTKLKSPPHTHSSHSKERSIFRTDSKKEGSSLFGA